VVLSSWLSNLHWPIGIASLELLTGTRDPYLWARSWCPLFGDAFQTMSHCTDARVGWPLKSVGVSKNIQKGQRTEAITIPVHW
jgi:hypothetical protein